MTRLPDDVLVRGRTRGVGTLQERLIVGWPYLAVSAWTAQEEARAAAAAIRDEGDRVRISREPCPERAGCPDQCMWVVWVPLDDPIVEIEEGAAPRPRPRPRPRRSEGSTPDPQRQLPDELLFRDYFGEGGLRTRRYEGLEYSVASIWETAPDARATASSLRDLGRLARVTQEKRPLRAYGTKTPDQILHLRRGPGRYMWVVWSGEKPACAGEF